MKKGFDLLKNDFLKNIIKARPFQFITQVPMVLVFVLVILTGLLGTQIPGKNFATVLTWTIWWAGIIFLILFSGATWCLFCPWMAMGNWVQRLAFWKKSNSAPGLERDYGFSKNRYPAIVFFFFVSALELGVLITYSPVYTAFLAIVMFFLATATALIWNKNVFCRYICFVGAIVGIYSNLSPLEARSRDKNVCGKCKSKDCITGNDKGYGCPTFEYAGGMEMNTNCILCTECIKTCPHDNMTINLRAFLKDVSGVFKGRMDEAILILVLLGLTIFHGVTMLPEWFFWATKSLEGNYSVYLAVFILAQTAFALVPILIHALLAYISNILAGAGNYNYKDTFIKFSYSFLPVAISFHLAHNLDHIRGEGHKFFNVISDPFGWGWNIFGTAARDAESGAHKMSPVKEDAKGYEPTHDMAVHDMGAQSIPAHETDARGGHAGHDMSNQMVNGADMAGGDSQHGGHGGHVTENAGAAHDSHGMADHPGGHDAHGSNAANDFHTAHGMQGVKGTHDITNPLSSPGAAGHEGHDMGAMTDHSAMPSMDGMMLHSHDFNIYNLVLILLGLLGGAFLAYRISKNTSPTGIFKRSIPYILAILAYSLLSWHMLNLPMVMRTQ